MKVNSIESVKRFWDGNYELIISFESDGYEYKGPFYLNSTDNAPASKQIREMLADGNYEGSIEEIAQPSEEEINTMIEQLKAKANGNP